MNSSKYGSLAAVKEYAKIHNLCSIKLWLEASEKKDFPKNLPKRPPNVYGCKWSEILNKKNIDNSKYLSFEEACSLVRTLGLKTMSDFRELGREGGRPSKIPSNPERYYKDKWQGWPYFLIGKSTNS